MLGLLGKRQTENEMQSFSSKHYKPNINCSRSRISFDAGDNTFTEKSPLLGNSTLPKLSSELNKRIKTEEEIDNSLQNQQHMLPNPKLLRFDSNASTSSSTSPLLESVVSGELKRDLWLEKEIAQNEPSSIYKNSEDMKLKVEKQGIRSDTPVNDTATVFKCPEKHCFSSKDCNAQGNLRCPKCEENLEKCKKYAASHKGEPYSEKI